MRRINLVRGAAINLIYYCRLADYLFHDGNDFRDWVTDGMSDIDCLSLGLRIFHKFSDIGRGVIYVNNIPNRVLIKTESLTARYSREQII